MCQSASFHLRNVKAVSSFLPKEIFKTNCGFDGISSKTIKTIKTTLIINQMLTTGIFSDKLKIAKVIPLCIHKKDEETLISNYRPISLLLAISKIFENVIFKQLYKKNLENKLLYNAQ